MVDVVLVVFDVCGYVVKCNEVFFCLWCGVLVLLLYICYGFLLLGWVWDVVDGGLVCDVCKFCDELFW